MSEYLTLLWTEKIKQEEINGVSDMKSSTVRVHSQVVGLRDGRDSPQCLSLQSFGQLGKSRTTNDTHGRKFHAGLFEAIRQVVCRDTVGQKRFIDGHDCGGG